MNSRISSVLTDSGVRLMGSKGEQMNSKEKMLEIIKKKQGGGRVKQMETPKNDRKNMRKGPKIYIK